MAVTRCNGETWARRNVYAYQVDKTFSHLLGTYGIVPINTPTSQGRARPGTAGRAVGSLASQIMP